MNKILHRVSVIWTEIILNQIVNETAINKTKKLQLVLWLTSAIKMTEN